MNDVDFDFLDIPLPELCNLPPEPILVERVRSEIEVDSKTGRFAWPAFAWIWQDFLPVHLVGRFSIQLSHIPSLLEFIPEVAQALTDGAYWFNFVFDWWFVSPLHEYEDVVPLIEESNLPWPCTKCTRRFQQEWQVSRHYIDTHVLPAKPETAVKPIQEIPNSLPDIEKEEEKEEVFVTIFDQLEDPIEWRWEDFLPDWDEDFLPTPHQEDFQTLDIFDPYPEPVPVPKPKPIPPPAEIKEITTRCILKICAPVLKQTKYFCMTCDKTICNSCFTAKCSKHNVNWMGQGKFACALC
ncbi:uncharacterized protein LOC111715422 [Eurytemora carolleeae]|uniref:uncharacterized protein LOC111715422 n=1 Tax=Eurytemora carolleeae TaxID=1294199 RepID=UPI000C76D079|nr:uncharacterized protein LOC111715422 [Eurytemora carolleeae]|eukprot:XP_023346505.1 uncharacterized protein LOC111715422 [Eurytemora affinis]